MALSNMTIVSNGNLEFVSISFNYLDRSEINVYFDSVPTSTWAWVGDTNQIKFTPKVPNGVTVLIARTTDASDLRHTFSEGAAFTAKTLDEDLRQVLHIVQEAKETNLSGNFHSDIDMNSNKITNLAPGSNPSDAVTFQQLQDLSPDAGLRADLVKDYANTGSGIVGFRQDAIGAVGRSVESKLRESISVRDFGAVGDGVVDDTDSVLAAHIYANSIGAPISYHSLSSIALRADASIPVNTNVDFCGCKIKPIGIYDQGDWEWGADIHKVYVIEDPSTPAINTTVDFTGQDLRCGSVTFCAGLFEGPAFVLMYGDPSTHKMSDRDATGYTPLVCAHYINYRGEAEFPLVHDYSTGSLNRQVIYRKFSESGRITIENAVLDASSINNSCIFYVERNNVLIKNISEYVEGFTFPVNKTQNVLISSNCVACLDLEDIYLSGTNSGVSIGSAGATYVFQPERSASMSVMRLKSSGEWGETAGNIINGLVYRDCVVSRIDVHYAGYNIFIQGGRVKRVQVGSGGGILSIDRVAFADSYRCISNRVDYGGEFFGTVKVRDITIDTPPRPDTSQYTLDVIYWSQAYPGNTVIPTTLPSIDVDGISIIPKEINADVKLSLLTMFRKSGSEDVYAPEYISFNNVCAPTPTRWEMDVDYGNFEMRPRQWRSELLLNNIKIREGASQGISIRSNSFAVVNPVLLHLLVHECAVFKIVSQWRGILRRSIISSTYISDLKINPGSEILIDGCWFVDNSSNPTNVGDGGGVGEEGRRIVISGATYHSGTTNLALVRAIQGFFSHLGSTNLTLPGGATADDIFLGWKI